MCRIGTIGPNAGLIIFGHHPLGLFFQRTDTAKQRNAFKTLKQTRPPSITVMLHEIEVFYVYYSAETKRRKVCGNSNAN